MRGSEKVNRIGTLPVYLLALLLLAPVMVMIADAEEVEKIGVVCTNSALADFVINVFGDEYADQTEVTFIMPGGACPAHFDARPSDAVLIAEAEVIVALGWEPWLEDLVTASGNEDAYRINCMGLGEWNIPDGAASHINTIMDGLSEHYPDWSDDFRDNADSYILQIEETFQIGQQSIIAHGLNGTRVVAVEWFNEFLDLLGFEIVRSFGSPETLSTADILNITDALNNDEKIAIIVDNLQSGVEFGANLAAETGKEHVVLSNFPGGIPGVYSYIDNMEYNINELINGATAYEENLQEISELEGQVSSLEFQRTVLVFALAVIAVFLAISVIVARRK